MISDVKVSYSERCTSFKFKCKPKYFDYIDANVQWSSPSNYLSILVSDECAVQHLCLSLFDKSLDLYSDVVIIANGNEYIIRCYKQPVELEWERYNEV